MKSRDIQVEPVLMLWGLGTSKGPESERIQIIDGVTVVTGRALKGWSQGPGADVLDEDRIAQAWVALDELVTRRTLTTGSITPSRLHWPSLPPELASPSVPHS
jgi:hypothetical protein